MEKARRLGRLLTILPLTKSRLLGGGGEESLAPSPWKMHIGLHNVSGVSRTIPPPLPTHAFQAVGGRVGMTRVDTSELHSELARCGHSVGRLETPGRTARVPWLGYGRGGLLTRALAQAPGGLGPWTSHRRKQPFSLATGLPASAGPGMSSVLVVSHSLVTP